MKNKSEARLRQFDVAYMDIAKRWALLSYAVKKQVGAIIVKDRMIISDGFNGTPKNFDNKAEDMDGKTHWYTLHAESNAILKLSTSTQSSIGATLYVTCCPCRNCAKLILQSKIARVVYDEDYKTTDGVDFLKKAGIQVQKMSEIKNNYTNIIDAFELDMKDNKCTHTHSAIWKSLTEKDLESVDSAANFILENHTENLSLIRAYLMETNAYKINLKNRNKVYVKAIQICDNSGLNTADFLSNLK